MKDKLIERLKMAGISRGTLEHFIEQLGAEAIQRRSYDDLLTLVIDMAKESDAEKVVDDIMLVQKERDEQLEEFNKNWNGTFTHVPLDSECYYPQGICNSKFSNGTPIAFFLLTHDELNALITKTKSRVAAYEERHPFGQSYI